MEAVFTECVDEFKSAGGTVLLSSHILAEVEGLCDRVSIIRNGRTVETGTLAELRHLTRTSIRAELASPPTGLDALPRRARPRRSRTTGSRFEVDTDAPRRGPAGARRPRASARLTSQPPTLEELFLRHYGDEVAARMTGALTGTGHPAAHVRPAGPVDGPVVHPRGDRPLLVAGGERRRPLHDAGGVRPGRRQHGGQRGLHRDDRPGARPEHDRRPGDLAVDRVRRDPDRADGDVPGRPAHPRRGGVRPRRAAPLGRGRPPGSDDRGAAADRGGQRLVGALRDRQPDRLRPGHGGRASPWAWASGSAGWPSARWRCWPPSSPPRPAPCTA